MHPPPPPPAYHGRANVPTSLPMQNKPPPPPPMANNIVPTAIQQRGQPLMQPKTILKHPSQYKPTVSQPQIQQQPQPHTSQPPSLDAVKVPQANAANIIPNSGTTGALHSTTSQSHKNNLSGSHAPAEKPKSITAVDSERLNAMKDSE